MKHKVILTFFFFSILSVYLYMSSEDKKWERYFTDKLGKEARPLFLKALKYLPDSGHALSLGTGVGNDELVLIKKNWKLDCVEKQEKAVEIFKSRIEKRDKLPQIKMINKSFSALKEEDLSRSYDFIYAGLSLPFAGESLEKFWKLTVKKLKPGGIFAGHFFGNNHEGLNVSDVAYLSEKELMDLFQDFETIHLNVNQSENDHIFEIIAKKI